MVSIFEFTVAVFKTNYISATKKLATLVAAMFAFLPGSHALAAAPNAVDDQFSTASGTLIADLLSANDLSLDGPADSYSKLTDPTNGLAVVNTDGSIEYTPNVGFAGVDQFSYQIDDGAGGTDSAIVQISVASSSNYLIAASPMLITQEDSSVPLGLSVSPGLFDGGALLDIISSETGFRSDSAGATPTVFTVPSGSTSVVVTGYSTQSRNTAGDNDSDDDYQLLNARIDLTTGLSSGRVAFINHGQLRELDQYAWEAVALGQAVLNDPAKIIGYHARENSNPIFKIVGSDLQIIESHTLETAYHVEFMTSDGDSTNFIRAGNTVQNSGISTSSVAIPVELEPASGKKGLIILNSLSAAAGSNSAVEHKGMSRIVIDLDSGMVSGAVAAQRGESSNNTITYGFKNYPLVDLRVGGSQLSVLNSSATIIGDTTGKTTVKDDPTIYINASGELAVTRSASFAATFTSMFTAEFYERTGFSSIASFVSVASDDTFFDSGPADGVDPNGKPIDEFLFDVPASARVGIFQASWDTTGGSDTNENIGMGFAIVDLAEGTSSGAITFIRTSTPDLLAWDAVAFGETHFGATDTNGNPLYQSNKTAGGFTDVFVETAKFSLLTNTDGSRTLRYTAHSPAGAQNYRDYQGNAQVSWLGNEPFEMTGVGSVDGALSHGSPTASGNWELDFSDLPSLSYIPVAHDSGRVELSFSLSSTGETEVVVVNIEPVTDPPALGATDAVGYVNTPLPVYTSIANSADTDGSETLPATVTLSNVPATVTLTAASGTVFDNGGGNWTVSTTALPVLMATGSTPVTRTITLSASNTDTDDIDNDSTVEDNDNGAGVDEYDDLVTQTTLTFSLMELPSVTALVTNNGTPTISGTANPGANETLSVTVNGSTYTAGDGNLVDNGDGTWDLTIPAANILSEGTYTVDAQLSHTNGATGIDTTGNELIIDLTPPPAPGVTSQTTQDTTPLISGTTTTGTGLILSVEVNGVTYTAGDGNLADNGDGTWELTIPVANALPDATYNVTATLTDAAGNANSDPGTDELVVDNTAPATPGVTSLSTNDATPTISGTALVGIGETLTVEVNGAVYTAGDGSLVDNADGTWDLAIPTANALPEATYDVTATVTDAALNTSTDPSSQELLVDTTAPVAPSIIHQTTNTTTPVISGTATINSGEVLSVEVNGVTYTAGDGHLTDNGNGTWSLSVPAANSIGEGNYEVTATVTDAAGNATSDSTSNELTIDLTPPPAPGVTFQLTNTDTPVISGTATLATGDTLSVTVDSITYNAGDGNLIDNGDGTWDLSIPTANALNDGSYDVIANITDSAGNSTSDATNTDLVIDTTPPPAPGVTSQTTNNQTPVISGTTTVGTGLTLTVIVNGITYTTGDGNLIDNHDGTWDLSIPAANTIPEATYDVLATLTDAAGNAASDPGTSELVVDITAPPTPGVTSLTTNRNTPVISGTAIVNAGDTLTVEVNGVTYTAGDGNLVDNADGTWDLTIPAANTLPEATYDVTAIVTDAALNTSTDPSAQELLIDTTAPVAPTVNTQIINTATPVISGTATVLTGEVLTVEVNGITYTAGDGNLVDNGDGTWDLTIPSADALSDADYNITATVTDGAGNSTSDSSASELTIDLTPPPAPAVTFQLTSSDTPVISGTATLTSGDTLTVSVDSVTYTAGDGNLVDNGDGTWDLSIPTANALSDASYNVVANITDSAGNSTSDATNPDLVIDTTPPPAPGVTSQTTNNQTPVISGTTTVGSGLTLTVAVNGFTYTAGDGNLVDNNDGTWDLSIPAANPIPEATYDVVATLTDAAGNAASDPGTSELVVDTTAPPTPGVTSLTTNLNTPVISGTAIVNAGDTLTVEVNGVTYTAGDGNLVDNADGTWDLTIPTANTLPEATYDVTAIVTDAALNTSTDPSAQELLIDTTAPVAPTVNTQIINTAAPVISGTATVLTGEVLTVEVNGITYTAGDGNLVDHSDGTWDLTIPTADALSDADYDITATVTDGAGNSTSDSSASELTIDLTPPPAPAVTFQLTNSDTPVISGTATLTPGDTLTVSVDSVTYTAGDGNLVDNGDGTWTLTIPPANALADASYNVVANITDSAGNSTSDATNTDLVIDTTPPPAPGVTSQTTNNQHPVISGTTTVGSGLTLTVAVNGVTYTAGDGNLVDNNDGTWDLSIPAANPIPEATYDVVATLTDAAGNAASDPGTSELVVDTTAPPTPGVTSLTTNLNTPVISGTAIVNAGDTLTVEVNGVTYTAGDGNLVDNADGTWDLTIPAANTLPEATYDVTAIVTDAALNTSTDPSAQELLIDTTAPVAPTVNTQIINTATPVISGTATVLTGEVLTVEVNGITYTAGDGNLVDNGDGTWELTIPASDALTENTYNVTAKVTDSAGNYTSDSTDDELIIDLTAPPGLIVTITEDADNNTLIGASESTGDVDVVFTLPAGTSAGYTVNITDGANSSSVTVTPAHIAAGSISTTFTSPADGETLTIDATLTDLAGNTSTNASDTATVDFTPTSAPGITINEDADNNTFINIAELAGPIDFRVALPADVTVGDQLTIDINGTPSTLVLSAVNIAASSYSGQTSSPGDGGSVTIAAWITDGAGNVSASSIDSATLDLTAPATPGVVTQISNSQTPLITGTATLAANDFLSVRVNGINYIAGDGNLIDNGDGSWSLAIPASQPLAESTYEVTATVTDVAGNASRDVSSNELVVDLTAPVQPTVVSQITNTATPVIHGTANPGPGETLTIALNSESYTAGDGHLIDHGDGTWSLTVPTANSLAEATYEVLATVTDLAGNSTSDGTANELIVDVTPPVAPSVTSLTTNTGTPVISGTATVGSGEVLTVTVNGITYTAGDGNLVDNGDGTWMLTIPPGDTLPDDTYEVTVTITDAAGNITTDSSATELVIDLTPPLAPTVTALNTNTDTPVIGGTATVGSREELTVTVNGTTYTAGDGNLTDNGDGTWTLAIPAANALTDGSYEVIATVTDAAGNSTSDSTANEVQIDLIAPVEPTVIAQVTNSPTPAIAGTATVGSGEVLTVAVHGTTYTAGDGNLTDNGDGTWELLIPIANALPEAVHTIIATVTDAAGNATSDTTSSELTIDITPPPAPGVTSQTTNNQSPVISGTLPIASGMTLMVTVNGITYTAGDGNLTDNGNGTWDLSVPAAHALPEATYDILATLTDTAGNSSFDPGANELVVDITAPPTPGVTSLTTNDTTPVISGTATVNTGDVLTVTVNGVIYTNGDGRLVHNTDESWDLTIPASNVLPEGTYHVTAVVTDPASNTATDPSMQELLIDTTAPAAPSVTTQTINTGTPVISGTAIVNSGETLTVTVNGIIYTAGDGNLTDNGDGTWTLAIPATDTLSDATYDVTVTVTDAANNTTSDSSAAELVIDLDAPVAPTVTAFVTNTATPSISGTANGGVDEVLTVAVGGVTYTAGDGYLVNNGDGTWTLNIPAENALSDGNYEVVATLTDAAGNAASDSSANELMVDLVAPVEPAVITQVINNSTPTITGTATVGTGELLTVQVNGLTYTAGNGALVDNGDGSWALMIPPADALPDAVYDVIATITDSAGNATSDTTHSELTIDTIAPPAPGVTSQTTNNQTPVISGTTPIATGLTLTVVVNGVTYTAGDGSLVDHGDGNWDLNIPAIDTLPEASYEVVATLTDAAGNSSSDPGTNDLVVDITSPATPGVTSLTTNSTTPVVYGTATINSGDVLTITVNGVLYSAGDGNLADHGNGTWALTIPSANALPEATYNVTAIVTDAAGNTATDPGSLELLIDTTAPVAPAVSAQTTNTGTPVISGTAIVGTGETLSVSLDGITYTAGDGNLTDNGDGTWNLVIPSADSLTDNTYEVTVVVTDPAGNHTTDSSNSELVIDLTPPVAPTVAAINTNTDTPVISGTATVAAGEVLTVQIDGMTYTAGDGNLTDNGDGTWQLNIPATNALTDGHYEVIATVIDPAGNTTGDGSTGELLVDLIAPVTPTVISQVINTGTPVINGTATVGNAEILTVEVNGTTYTAGDGNLQNHGNETWSLTIPTANALPEAVYDVTATVTDVAGNTTSDTTAAELTIDLTPPPAPGVTSQTTNNQTPVISGTAAIGSDFTLSVTANGVTYTQGDGNLVNNGDGTWDLSIPAINTLPEATYDVIAMLSDTAGNTSSDPGANELVVDLTSPATPGVTSLTTNSTTPVINGTATVLAGDVLTVTVDGVLYTARDGNLTDNSDGTWTLAIPAANALAEAIYNVTAVVTDPASNTSTDPGTRELLIDLTAPVAPAVSSQTTNTDTPEISGTAVVNNGEMLTVTINGKTYTAGDGNLTDNGDGTWQLALPETDALSDDTYDVIVTVTDAAGNTTTDSSSAELVVDSNAPVVPTVTPLVANTTTPTISGTASPGSDETLTVAVNGTTYTAGDGNLTDNGDGTWMLTIPPSNPLPEGSYDVTALVTDPATNTATDSSSQELLIDTTAPLIPTVNAQTINTGTPVISGTATVDHGEILTVSLNGVTYTAGDGNLTDNDDGTWSLTIPPGNALSDNLYDITAILTDPAGNSTSDSSSTELVVDLTAPVVPTVTAAATNTTTPVIEGTATVGSDEVLTVVVEGTTYTHGDGNLVLNGDGTWTLTVPTEHPLTDGSYEILATISDAAGNSASDNSASELFVDLIAPVAPAVHSQISNSPLPVISGTATIGTGEILTVDVNGNTYTAGDGSLIDNGDGTWDLIIPSANPLPEGVFNILATVTDPVGNTTSDNTAVDLTVDLTPPPAPGVTSQTTNDQTPVISGITTAGTGLTLTVSVNNNTYTAGDGHLTDNGDGTWNLVIPASDSIAEGHYDVVAALTDNAGNTASDPGNNELVVDTTAPPTPGVTSLTTNDTTPVIQGTATLGATDTLSVEVNGTVYTSGNSSLEYNNDGTWALAIPSGNAISEGHYEITAIVTDAAGNTSTDPSFNELLIDLTAPVTPAATAAVATSSTPTLSGVATLNAGEILRVSVNGVVYTDGDGNLTDHGDGTWSLQIPADQSIADGIYPIEVSVTDLAGNISYNHSGQNLTIDTGLPALSAQTTGNTRTFQPEFSGTSDEPDGSAVRVTDNNGNELCIAIVAKGNWNCTSAVDLPEGINTLHASVTDAAGNRVVTQFSAEISSDLDGDGIPNIVEGNADSDSDGIADSIDLDSDNDGIADIYEEQFDTDNDGIPNYLDLDSDNDGIPDTREVLGNDIDRDFVVDNFIDNDGDGLSDALQSSGLLIPDTDFDGVPDYMDVDSDNDGVPDLIETDGFDTDNNGRIDEFSDTNKDGVDDGVYAIPTLPRDTDGDGTIDYLDKDSDNDGKSDLRESGAQDYDKDHIVDSMKDTDRDAIPDSVDVSFTFGSDDDNDGIDDRYDASMLQADDQDNDGIADTWDPDANGDGWADTVVKGVTFARALPDENNNGVADIIDPGPASAKINTGLHGHGGCALRTNVTPIDPALPALLTLSILMLGRRPRRRSILPL